MKNTSAIILFLLFYLSGNAQNQDLRLKVSGAVQILQSTKFLDSVYTPENADFTYYENVEGQGVINRSHIFNGYSLGTMICYNFRKSTLSLEPQYFMRRSVFRFQGESYSERVVGMKAFRLPIFYSYQLFKKNNSMFLSVGTVLTYGKNFDFQHAGAPYLFSDGPIYKGGTDHGDGHFKNILYNEGFYRQNFFGVGKSFGKVQVSMRFMSRTRLSKLRIRADIAQIELHVSYDLLGLSDLRKKHDVYHE
ncbi:MAG: hypothetical protein R3277_02810 [Brumimicrobium sp.]|nr:hypothetical protein [Brumimicrobium sp.]